MVYRDIDPATVSWRQQSVGEIRAAILAAGHGSRPVVCAIDGHSGAGKSTHAALLAAGQREVAVVHTDDLAWHHSFFDWADLLIDGVLDPVRHGRLPVAFRPPAWPERGREGSVSVPDDADILLIEGVGAARREAQPYLDYVIWVHVPEELGCRRLTARADDDPSLRQRWMVEENAFFERHRPWAVADLLIDGRHLIPVGEMSTCAEPHLTVARNAPDVCPSP